MKYEEVYNKAKEVIGEENIYDYRPAVFSAEQGTFLEGVNANVPNTIMIWLKNGDCIWYRAKDWFCADGERRDPCSSQDS